MIDIKALNKALVKSMISIAKNAKKYQGANIQKKIDEAVDDINEQYKKEAGPMDNDIDLENITIIKENE